jgi:hypothetical protein
MTARHYFMCVIMLVLVVTFADAYTWTATSSLPEGRRGAAVVYYNGYVYCTGGRLAADATFPNPHADAGVYYAKVNADGSIGAWTSTTALPEALACHGAAAYDGYLYVWGGWESSDLYPTSNNCYYAPIQPNGSVGTWVTSSVTIPLSGTDNQMDAFGQGILAFNDILYILNGEDNSGTKHKEVYYSKIQVTHDYGPWTATSSTDQICWFHGVIIYQGTSANYIYRVAGNYSGTSERDVYFNTITPSGALGSATWTKATGSLPITAPQGRYEFGCAIADNKIFVIGGISGSTAYSNVYYGEINPATGDIASWVEDTTPYPAGTVARNMAVGYSAAGAEYVLAVGGGIGSDAADGLRAECYYTQVKSAPPPTPSPTEAGFAGVTSAGWTLYE